MAHVPITTISNVGSVMYVSRKGKRVNFEFCRQKETFRYPTPACVGACICFVSAENAVHKSFLPLS